MSADGCRDEDGVLRQDGRTCSLHFAFSQVKRGVQRGDRVPGCIVNIQKNTRARCTMKKKKPLTGLREPTNVNTEK